MLTAHGTRPLVAGMVLVLAACTNSQQTRAPASPETPATTSPAGSRPIDLSSLSGRIAFSAGPARAEDIYVVKADGTGLRQVTTDPAADFDPTQSPDGKQMAYRHQVGDDRSTDIYVIDVDGSGERNLSRNEGVADWGPAWSPDGSAIAFNSDRQSPGRLRGYVMDSDGSGVRRIGGDTWVEYPAWSPDGSQIAFMAQTPEGTQNYEIFVVNADGTDPRRLTESPGDDGWPTWSPGGTRILFSSVRDDCSFSDAMDCKTTGDIGPYHTLYVMNADGSAQVRLTDAFGQISDWSPDGRYVVFEDFEGRDGLSLIRSDGSGLTTLPLDLSSPGFPDWIP
jgi:TolB protein